MPLFVNFCIESTRLLIKCTLTPYAEGSPSRAGWHHAGTGTGVGGGPGSLAGRMSVSCLAGEPGQNALESGGHAICNSNELPDVAHEPPRAGGDVMSEPTQGAPAAREPEGSHAPVWVQAAPFVALHLALVAVLFVPSIRVSVLAPAA